MAIIGTCDECGGDMIDYACPTCLFDTVQELAWELAETRDQFALSRGVSAIPCARCGGPVIEFTIPTPLWNAVIRGGGKERDDEYICYECWLKAMGEFVEQAAREHAAWQAMRTGVVDTVGVDFWRNGIPTAFAAEADPGICCTAADPASAVLLAVAKQEPGTELDGGQGQGSTEDRPH